MLVDMEEEYEEMELENKIENVLVNVEEMGLERRVEKVLVNVNVEETYENAIRKKGRECAGANN